MKPQLTLGPVLYNWPGEHWRDFYFRIADEAPVDTVFLGEVVCSKRAPLFDPYLEEVVTRLDNAGKKLVFSSLAEVASNIDRRLMKRVAGSEDMLIEANDTSALWHLEGRPHTIGPYINAFNEYSLEFFAENGATSICLAPETPGDGVAELAKTAKRVGVELEVQVFGRMPLALSARCYHARAHGLTKDSCKFICDRDMDGMVLETLENKPFLVINGIQTLSYTALNLVNELGELVATGINRFRISPQSVGTVEVCKTFRSVLDRELSAGEANDVLADCGGDAPFANGFYHRQPGFEWHAPQVG